MEKNINVTNDESLKESLLTRLRNKLKLNNVGPTVKQFFKKLAITGFAFFVLSGSGCADTPIVPGGTGGAGGGENPGIEQPLSNYSQVLQNLLEDEYYDDLIARAKADNSLYNTGYFYPLPYSFLEDQGHNIEQIKQGTLKSQISAYTYKDDPNSLYIAVGVETKASKPYYTQYILKYNLTQKEMDDYKMLHAGYYIQAVFINDAISEYKTPTIVAQNKITVEAYDAILDYQKKSNHIKGLLNNSDIGGLTLFNYDLEKQTFEVQIRSSAKSGHTMITNNGIIVSYPYKRGSHPVKLDSNNAFCQPFMAGTYYPGDNAINAEGKEITQYQSQYVYLENTNDLETKISE